jgi:hypothetical protein
MAIKIHRENALEMEYTFSELQKAAYEQQGFLIVRAVLPADETLALQRWRPVGNALALCAARALPAARFRRNTTDGGFECLNARIS